jgi:hypothetical protein
MISVAPIDSPWTMTATYALLGLYVVAFCGYAARRTVTSRAHGPTVPTLLLFGFWNIAVALTAAQGARLLMRMIASAEGGMTMAAIISLAPLALILGGNIVICIGAYRMAVDRRIVLLLASWIAASLFTIMILGAISPFTFLMNLLS